MVTWLVKTHKLQLHPGEVNGHVEGQSCTLNSTNSLSYINALRSSEPAYTIKWYKQASPLEKHDNIN